MDRQVRVMGVPMDLGADRRGVDMGPSAIRYGGLADRLASIGVETRDVGDIAVPRPEETDPDDETPVDGTAKFFAATRDVCVDVAAAVGGSIAADEFPLVLGGDHSIAVGTVNGLEARGDVGVLWFDAHGDCNTPTTTPSGNVHGMALAALLGVGEFADHDWAVAEHVDPSNVALVGVRDLDDGEKAFLRDSDVATYTMSDVDQRGVAAVVEEALGIVCDGTDGLHVSLDLDWLDPTEAPGVGTPVRGGVSYREGHVAMEIVHREAADRLASLELVEVNPILDSHNETAELAGELAASALGERII